MEDEKKRIRIDVETLPNGYALTVDREEYLYLSAIDLLAGMFYHVGLERLDNINPEQVEMIIEAILSWPSIKDAAQSQARCMSDMKNARSDLNKTRRQLADTQKKLIVAEDSLCNANKMLRLYKSQAETTDELTKRIESFSDAMQKLNRRNVRLEKENRQLSLDIAALKRNSKPCNGEKKDKAAVDKVAQKKRHRTRKDGDKLVIEELRLQHKDLK